MNETTTMKKTKVRLKRKSGMSNINILSLDIYRVISQIIYFNRNKIKNEFKYVCVQPRLLPLVPFNVRDQLYECKIFEGPSFERNI